MFPPVENMGQVAVRIEELTHGYNGDKLFQDAGGGSGNKHAAAAALLFPGLLHNRPRIPACFCS